MSIYLYIYALYMHTCILIIVLVIIIIMNAGGPRGASGRQDAELPDDAAAAEGRYRVYITVEYSIVYCSILYCIQISVPGWGLRRFADSSSQRHVSFQMMQRQPKAWRTAIIVIIIIIIVIIMISSSSSSSSSMFIIIICIHCYYYYYY